LIELRMKKILIAGAVALGILSLALVWLVGSVLFGAIWGGDRSLARNLPVTSEWTEVSIDPPVTPAYRQQTINLRPVNFEVDRNAKGFDIRLPDGRVVAPEVEIYDEKGNMFPLYKTGFAMGRSDYVVFKNYDMPFRRDTTYSLLRIRSDMPFVCESIYWIDYDPK
jgi:hypothetical protein